MNLDGSTPLSAEAAYERGQLLQQQSRFRDAAEWFERALQADPNHAPSYAMLSFCWTHDPARSEQAVDAARRAVALAPETGFYYAILAIATAGTAKEGQEARLREALQLAQQAVAQDPDSDFAHSIQAQMLLRLRRYPDAEASARHALSLNPENPNASEILSIALRMQHKDEDNAELVRYQLERNPEEDSSHSSAGWLALSQGDHLQANRHFLEALRLNPMNEGARLGLIESYRARSFVYGQFLKFAHFMNRFSEGKQNAIMFGGFIAYQLLRRQLSAVSPLLTSILVAVWLTFALWSHLARGVGSFFMLFDGFARRALTRREFAEGLAVGGVALLAVGVLGWGWASPVAEVKSTALALFFSSITSAAAFTNDHHTGKWAYGAAAVAAGLGALGCLLLTLAGLDSPVFALCFAASIFTGVAVSWLRPLRVGYA